MVSRLAKHFRIWGASNKGRIDFSYNSDPTINAGACARIEATDDVNYGGYLDFQNRTVGSANSNMNSRLFIKSTGLIGVNNNNPLYTLDVNGTISGVASNYGADAIYASNVSGCFMSLRLDNSNGQMLRVGGTQLNTLNNFHMILRICGVGNQEYARWNSNGFLGLSNPNPMYQLDVAGSANVSNLLLSQTHSNSGNFQSSYIQSATLSNTGNLSVRGNCLPRRYFDEYQSVVHSNR
jgi:hypothetical protein